MHRETHIVFGALTSAVVIGGGLTPTGLAAIAGGAVGGILPDFDVKLPLKHRGLSHTVWPAIAIMAGGLFLPQPIAPGVIGMGLGYLSHLAADAMTVSGVTPFAPVSAWRIKGWVRTVGNERPFFFREKRRGRGGSGGKRWDWNEQIIALGSILALLLLLFWH